jgi:hypothetical protein
MLIFLSRFFLIEKYQLHVNEKNGPTWSNQGF